jgi:cytidine deaminase
MNPELVAKAAQARQRAIAPFSGFKVGAAIATRDGHIYTGCNMENASYGLGICAERVALWKALSEGATKSRRHTPTGLSRSFRSECETRRA